MANEWWMESLGDYSTLGGFIPSAVSSFGELFGDEANLAVQEWRARNPELGLVSEFVSPLGYYGGAMMAMRQVPALARWSQRVDRIGDVSAMPVRVTALREAVRFAPFEAARPLIAWAAGNDVPETALEAGVDTLLAGAVGGVIGAFRGAGTAVRRRLTGAPGVDLRDPAQLQMRQTLRNLREDLPDRQRVASETAVAEYRRLIRSETSDRYLRPLRGFSEGSQRSVENWFRPRNAETGVNIRRLVRASNNGVENVDAIARRAQFPENWEAYLQYPRYMRAGSDSSAKRVVKRLDEFQQVADETWITREVGDQMYVVARRIGRGRPQAARGAAGDEWVLFKTDSPGEFIKTGAKWSEVLNRRSAFLGVRDDAVDESLDIMNSLSRSMNEVPIVNYLGLGGKTSGLYDFLTTRLKLGGQTEQMRRILSRFINEYFTPTQFQFGKNPRANWIHSQARMTYDQGNLIAERLLWGKSRVAGKSLWNTLRPSGLPQTGGVLPLVDELSDAELRQVWEAWSAALSPAEAREVLGVSGRALNFLEEMQGLDDYLVRQLKGTFDSAGIKFTPRRGHYAISRTWRGDIRMPVYNEDGQLIYVASGRNRGQAQTQAEGVVREAAEEGREWRVGEYWQGNRADDTLSTRLLNTENADFRLATQYDKRRVRRPGFAQPRQGVGGYTAERRPFTRQELKDSIDAHVRAANRKMSEIAVNKQLSREMFRLADEDPVMHTLVSKRMDDLRGEAGILGKAQNAVADKIMSPFLGKNSATKIARAANGLVFNFQLGMGNLAFPVINALTFVQTVLPHVAFIKNAAPDEMLRHYNIMPAIGTKGVIGSTGVLDPWRLTMAGMREMGRPSQNLRRAFERAADDGVISPRMVEEYVGENARTATNWRGALSSPGGFASWLKSLSEALPTLTEKFSRTHAFSTGYVVGRDLLRLDGDQLYNFAKQFTQRTMYAYGTADRARIFTTPMGSMFGLFKNWLTHYIFSLMDYIGTGVSRNNWAPMMWMLGGTMAVGGAATTPLWYAADRLSHMFTDEGLMTHLYDAFGGRGEDGSPADAIIWGLPAYLPQLVGLPGVSFTQTTQLPFTDPAHDMAFLTSFAHFDRMRSLGMATGNAMDRWYATGENPFENRDITNQFVRALAPRSIYRTMASTEEGMIRSMFTGYPSVSGVSLGERMLYSMGFNPTWVNTQWEVGAQLWREQNSMRTAVQNLGQQWMAAQAAGDSEEMSAIVTRALGMGVDVSSVLRSAASREYRANTNLYDRQFSQESLWRYRRLGLVPGP